MLILRGRIYAEAEHVIEREKMSVINLLPRVTDRIFERDVMPRAQRAHIRPQTARRDALFELAQIFRRRIGADECLAFRSCEQTGQMIASSFDAIQRGIKTPLDPGPIETTDGPLDSCRRSGRVRKIEDGGYGSRDGSCVEKLAAIHKLVNPSCSM